MERIQALQRYLSECLAKGLAADAEEAERVRNAHACACAYAMAPGWAAASALAR